MESKQDVFDSALDELRYAISLAKEPVAEDLSDEDLLDDLRARYAAAGKVPVPRGIAELLSLYKRHVGEYSLAEVFENALDDVENYESAEPDYEWIVNHECQFTEAWNHGWYAEEDVK